MKKLILQQILDAYDQTGYRMPQQKRVTYNPNTREACPIAATFSATFGTEPEDMPTMIKSLGLDVQWAWGLIEAFDRAPAWTLAQLAQVIRLHPSSYKLDLDHAAFLDGYVAGEVVRRELWQHELDKVIIQVHEAAEQFADALAEGFTQHSNPNPTR